MKRAISAFLLATVLIGASAQAAHAQISFLFGVAVGASLSGGDQVVNGGISGNTIYILPRVSERVKNPLSIQFAQFDFWQDANNGMSLYTMFKRVEPVAERYEVLEVVRMIKPANQAQAVFWFAYTEKSNVLSLEALPKK